MLISRIFTFDAAHILPEHPGKCHNLHGHTYTLTVTVKGKPDLTTGMVIDYGDLKEKVNKVLEKYDHSFLVNQSPTSIVERSIGMLLAELNLNLKVIRGPTTTENIAKKLYDELFRDLDLFSLKLAETPTTFVEVTYGNL